MILSRETVNQLAEHPLPPMAGYVIIYGYANSLWLQRSSGDKFDLLDGTGIPSGGTTGQVLAKESDDDYDAYWITIPESGGGGGVSLWGQQGVQSMTADTWYQIVFSTAMGDDQYTITPLEGLRPNGDHVPIKIKNVLTTGFSAWAARDCTFRWAVIRQ